jgi:hypothetical protein
MIEFNVISMLSGPETINRDDEPANPRAAMDTLSARLKQLGVELSFNEHAFALTKECGSES